MDSTIDLQGFSSIFEIFLAYYIGTSSSETLKRIFGIEANLKKRLEKLHLNFPRGQINASYKALTSPKSNQKIDYKTELKKLKDYKKKLKLLREYEDLVRYIHYIDEDVVWKCLQPFYIFSGIFALCLLLLGGVLTGWQRYDTLMFLNWIAFIVFIIALLRIFFRLNNAKPWGTIKSYAIGSALIFFIFLPNSWVNALPHLIPLHYSQWCSHNLFFDACFKDLLIIISVILVFSTLIVHIIVNVIFWIKIIKLNSKIPVESAQVYTRSDRIIGGVADSMSEGIEALINPSQPNNDKKKPDVNK